eukprot:1181672-Prorocentrum_minimum.AAC.2
MQGAYQHNTPPDPLCGRAWIGVAEVFTQQENDKPFINMRNVTHEPLKHFSICTVLVSTVASLDAPFPSFQDPLFWMGARIDLENSRASPGAQALSLGSDKRWGRRGELLTGLADGFEANARSRSHNFEEPLSFMLERIFFSGLVALATVAWSASPPPLLLAHPILTAESGTVRWCPEYASLQNVQTVRV